MLLDTSVVLGFVKNQFGEGDREQLDALLEKGAARLGTFARHELRRAVAEHPTHRRNGAVLALMNALPGPTVSADEAMRRADLMVEALARQGMVPGVFDLLIGAEADAHELPLATADEALGKWLTTIRGAAGVWVIPQSARG